MSSHTLPLALTFGELPGLLLVRTPGYGARALGCGFFARRALYLLALQFVFNLFGVRHYFP